LTTPRGNETILDEEEIRGPKKSLGPQSDQGVMLSQSGIGKLNDRPLD